MWSREGKPVFVQGKKRLQPTRRDYQVLSTSTPLLATVACDVERGRTMIYAVMQMVDATGWLWTWILFCSIQYNTQFISRPAPTFCTQNFGCSSVQSPQYMYPYMYTLEVGCTLNSQPKHPTSYSFFHSHKDLTTSKNHGLRWRQSHVGE